MANNVIHGIGKPRILLPRSVVTINDGALAFEDLNCTISSKVVTLTGLSVGDLDKAEAIPPGLINRQIIIKSSGIVIARAKIVSYDDAKKQVTIDDWTFAVKEGTYTCTITNFILDLPYGMPLIESFSLDSRVNKLYNGNIKRNIKGWYYSCVLDFSAFLKKADVQALRHLFNISQQEEFVFIPRRDNYNVNYLVSLDPDYVFTIRQGMNHYGHKGVILRFSGTQRLTAIELLSEVTDTPGYGDNYGGSDFYGYGDVL